MPVMPPVNAEIGIRGQQHLIVQRLGHAHKTGVSETHRFVRVFFLQLECGIHLVGEPMAADEGAPAKYDARLSAPRPPGKLSVSDSTGLQVSQGGGKRGA